MKGCKERVALWKRLGEAGEERDDLEETLMDDLDFCMHHIDEPSTLKLIAEIVQGLPLVEEPAVALDGFVRILQAKKKASVAILRAVVTLVSVHGADLPDFFKMFHDLLTPFLFMESSDELLLMTDQVLKAENLSLAVVRSIVKRLAFLALRVDTLLAHKILGVISRAMQRHPRAPVPYKNREEKENTAEFTNYQPYLFEIDALKDHPVLGNAARAIKSSAPVERLTEHQFITAVEREWAS
ncbi:U3 small nucleolar RNA-associated protein 19 [Nematocida displodere]|uniref:U3 small nucleolar RNA-associated protein 19 n=1 Tax=Nematocida displodere TaxID=1805483 RepID=A0A177EJ54_9MICR|nr:U3 small nucleolar RNA-associated protein 19 [Nematocida displodere]